jgi:prenyl protein peptidase
MVTIACIVAASATLYLIVVTGKASPLEAIHLMGWWPIKPLDYVKSCCLVLVLYTGPLFEIFLIERDFRGFSGWQEAVATLTSWQGYRNYVAGPVTEEVIFRSVLIPLHLLAKISPSKIVFLTPLYFGLAHVHHLYDYKLDHPHTPLVPAIMRSLFQCLYTTLFGWLASFIYLRTGSMYPSILIHSFCNWVGLPRLWGRPTRRENFAPAPVMLRGKDDRESLRRARSPELGNAMVVAYYVLLVLGVYGFAVGLWPLTESTQAALTTFGAA